MANIKISALEITVDNSVIEKYNSYIAQADADSRNAAELEDIFKNLYGAKRVGGSRPLVPDFTVPSDSLVLGLAPIFKKERSGELNIEAKFTRRSTESSTETTIGGRVIGSVAKELQRSLKVKGSADELYDLIKNQLGVKGGAELFNFLQVNTPRFHREAYNKAKNLTIFGKKSSTSVIAYQIFFPYSSFKSDKFGVGYEADNSSKSFTFSYFLRNSFENSLKKAVIDNLTATSLEKFKNQEYDKYKKTTKTVKFGRTSSETVEVYWAHSNSIPVANITTKINKRAGVDTRTPSIIDITMLVRGRARLKMRRGTGTPTPPKIYERSGTFRGSIQAVANMKNSTINYFYTPYYDSLEKYGYKINDLVQDSIRAIAQERLGGQFVLRRNMQSIN